jgi:hypothetical protein
MQILSIATIIVLIMYAISQKRVILNNPFQPTFVIILLSFTIFVPLAIADEIYKYPFETKLAIFYSGIAFIFINWILTKTIISKKIKTKPEESINKKYILFLYLSLIGWLVRVYLIKNGIFSGSSLATNIELTSTSNFFTQLAQISLYGYLGILLFKPKNTWNKLTIILFLFEVFWFFLSGTKMALFTVLIPTLMIGHYRGWLRVSIGKFLIISILGFSVIYSSFIFIKSYRTEMAYLIVSGRVNPSAIADSVGTAFSSLLLVNSQKQSEDKNFSILYDIAERVNYAAFLGRLINSPNINETWFGSSLIPSLTWVIPRALWPEKPSISVGRWYGITILGWSPNEKSEAAITIWGDGYMNFGIFGILIFIMIWALLFHLIYKKFYFNGGFSTYFAILSYQHCLFGLEQNLTVTLVKIQFAAIITFLMYKASNINISTSHRRLVK